MFQRDTRKQIFDRALSNIDTKIEGADARMPMSNLNGLAYLHAEAIHSLYGYGQWIAAQIDERTADVETIQRRATLHLDQPQKPAAAAHGLVEFGGTNGSIIAAGTVLTRSDAAEFLTLTEVMIAAGVAAVEVQAAIPGQAGNTAGGSLLTITTTIPGVNAQAEVDADGLIGGADIEDIDTSVRARLIAHFRERPHGGALFDYKRWALEVPGVTRAWPVPAYFGQGTVAIFFVRDDDASIIPDAGEVEDVQEYIHDPTRAPVATKGVVAVAPVGVPLNLTIELLVDASQAVKDAVDVEIRDLLLQEASPGATILISHIREAISRASGERDHILTVPAGNVVHDPNEIAIPGVITWV